MRGLNIVDIGFIHLPQKLAGKAERIYVAALSFGVNGVKGQAALATATDPGETTNFPRGISTSIGFRLCCRTPLAMILSMLILFTYFGINSV